ncbi:unnamed protein product, partial [Candidula unifasciata]
QQGITKFWENFGYVSSEWKDLPSEDIKFIRKRAMQLSVTLQCDMCLKWRMIPFNSNNIGKDFPDHWVCTMNPDQLHNKCSSAEQKLNIPEGVLKKEFKSQEQKKKDLEEEILRKTEMLEKLQKMKVVQSSKDIDTVLKVDDKTSDRTSLSRRAKAKSPSPPPSPKQNKSRSSSSQNNVPAKKSLRSPSPPPRPSPRQAASKPPPASSRAAAKSARSPSPPPRRAAAAAAVKAKQAESKAAPKAEPRKRIQKPAESSSEAEEEEQEEEEEEQEEEEVEEAKGRRGRSQNNADQSEAKKDAKKAKLREPTIEYPEIPVKKRRISHLNAEVPEKPEAKSTESQAGTDASASDGDQAVQSRATRSRGKGSNLKNDDMVDENEAQPTETPVSKDASEEDGVGKRVEAQVNSKWYPATVTQVNSEGKWKIKFDHHPKDKYDKWFDKAGPDIRMLDIKQDSSETPPSPSSQDGAEAPTSSTTTPAVTSQITEDIANGYRTCLRYFLPPQWIMDKDAITAMSLQELSDFPLDDFFDHYERGLRRLVSNFQTEATVRKQESEETKTKLVAVRKLIAKLLKSTNEDFDIDPEESGDQVDELLAACVRQATSQT